ncbi:xanthine dehydrogenase accessory protein XdhC [Rhodosalinus sp. FB01]|uniref:xanthine dehydrogenase accessory protein XdhC n=1 Tax=Rhodosalinus sp. FB01 TaxID=3239194 RepID=UPI0035237079
MALDRAALAAAVAREGRVARVVVAEARGSAPRAAGAAMLVWAGGQAGSIGGGALEHAAAARARVCFAEMRDEARQVPLGPDLGQCCGGAVRLVTECFDAARLAQIPEAGLWTRALPGAAPGADPPAGPGWAAGWFAEEVSPPGLPVWIWGAGHVGRALAGALAPLPGLSVTLADTGPERLPDPPPEGVAAVPAADLPRLAAHAPEGAWHYVMTYSHEIDLALCDALLRRGFAGCGLIGSATKWARFRKRLEAAGHAPEAVARIRCPIGEPSLGKHPQAIAVGVAAALLARNPAAAGP